MLSVRLKKLRKNKHITQAELGKMVNVTKSTVSMWEKGMRKPNTTTLGQLADLFCVSTDYLLGKANNPSFCNNSNSAIDIDDGIPIAYNGKIIPNEYLNIIKKLMDSDFKDDK